MELCVAADVRDSEGAVGGDAETGGAAMTSGGHKRHGVRSSVACLLLGVAGALLLVSAVAFAAGAFSTAHQPHTPPLAPPSAPPPSPLVPPMWLSPTLGGLPLVQGSCYEWRDAGG